MIELTPIDKKIDSFNIDSNFRTEHKAKCMKIDGDTCVEMKIIYFHYFIYEWKLRKTVTRNVEYLIN